MAYYRDLREFVSFLEGQGKLWRYSEPINKDTQLIPFHRLQLRGVAGDERRPILFERPINGKGREYAASVLTGIYGGSDEIYRLGLQCTSHDEVLERWHQALSHPIEPVMVDDGPVHEVVITGDELLELGLEGLPAPVEDPGYSCMIRTGTPMVTRDPVTGKRNAGAYNAFFRSRTRMVAGFNAFRQSYQHFLAYRKRGERCPVAVVIGSTPNFMATASAQIPAEMDEYAAAGGLVGEPMELVRCKTIDLEVPASAEIVIEGWFDHSAMEARPPFGEYPGFINMDWNQCPVIHVTAITHRRNPMFTPILVGFTPSDTNVLARAAKAGLLFHQLHHEQGLPVVGVECPEAASDMTVVRVERSAREQAWDILEAASGFGSKWVIAVDEDITPVEPELLLWALTYSVRSPGEAVRSKPRRGPGLDPSAAPPDAGARGAWKEGSPLTIGMINAMRPWAYPPVALPARQYMEDALALWERTADAPRLKLRTPWHGYDLGYWTEESEELARLMTEGEFMRAGELLLEYQTELTDEAAEWMQRGVDRWVPKS